MTMLLLTALLLIQFVCNERGINLATGPFMSVFSLVTAICLLVFFIMPYTAKDADPESNIN